MPSNPDSELLQSLIDSKIRHYGDNGCTACFMVLSPRELDEILALHAHILIQYPLYTSFRNENGEIEFRIAETSDFEEHF